MLEVIDGLDQHLNNRRTYAMKGEWMRVEAGPADRGATIELIVDA